MDRVKTSEGHDGGIEDNRIESKEKKKEEEVGGEESSKRGRDLKKEKESQDTVKVRKCQNIQNSMQSH